MTYKDLLDTLTSTSGDKGTAYRINAMTWLNLARQDAASLGSWKSTKNSEATLTTSASNTTGIYELTGIDEVIGAEMYDLTSHTTIDADTENKIMRMEVTPNQFGPPVIFADAGMTALGEKKIRLWPIPNDVRIIAYLGSVALIDVTTANELVSIDPYFGPLSACGAMLAAGLNFYRTVDDNEDVANIAKAEGAFHAAIKRLSGQSGVDANKGTRMEPVNRRFYYQPRGRFDPGHYGN